MNWGGIIAGAIGGGAQAAGQMADMNIKAQAEEERFNRERAARMQEAQTQRTWRKEDAIWEMDQRLARIAGEVKAKTQAGIESQGMLNAEREKIRGGLIGAEIDKAIPPHIAEQSKNWSPEARAQLEADKEAVRKRAMSDPSVGREVGLAMGEINQKDVMLNDVAQERAKNQMLQAQMRDEREIMKEEGRNNRADARIEALISGIGKGGWKSGDISEKLSTVIREQRQVVEAYQKRKEDVSYRSWARNNPDQAKQLDADIDAARDMIRAATAAQKARMGSDFGEQQPTDKPVQNTASPTQKSTDKPEVRDERIRIIRDEYDAAVKRGDKEVADSTAKELKKQFGVDVGTPEAPKPAKSTPQNVTPDAVAATAKKYGITEAQVLERLGIKPEVGTTQIPQGKQAPQENDRYQPTTLEEQQQFARSAKARIIEESKRAQQAKDAAAKDAELRQLEISVAEALRSGKPVQANNIRAQINQIKKERYGL